ncbi:serine/threonine protein kinase [Bifidobacterium eulemuris]|uniref:Serine/threonine protein kinase n=1 Tax=Bifidobacterium eulemuris TaxID=1765219 RepID=A0A261GDJ7_9BIFI|nr:serine/threonine-protein kinase [Bifidobacterium eulemuris]OZG69205.1 serine/threonine protein kinase [Bifidobacterium eulemuris]QOL31285.1 serine/threonine protein kinase [Bifidobacterium eulemuris]
MDDKQTMHAMSIDDSYHVERVLARGAAGVTELVSIAGTGPFVRKKIPTQLARRRVWSALADCRSARLPQVQATYELPDCFVVVYDYVEGSTLDQIVNERGRMPAEQAAHVIEQVCEAVQELHAHGIVHRDISPSNIILADDGAHLIDLGIARMRTEQATHDTTALGTWGFASPEQYGFAQTDARSDVYSIGRLFGYLLTGVYPDDAAYEKALADESIVPPRLRAVILKACAFEPSARQQSAEDLRLEALGRRNPRAETHTKVSDSRHSATQRHDKGKPRWSVLRIFATSIATVFIASVIVTVATVAFSFYAAEHFDGGNGSDATPQHSDSAVTDGGSTPSSTPIHNPPRYASYEVYAQSW